MSTELDVSAIRARAEAATEGPWEAFRKGDPNGPFGVASDAADFDEVYYGSSRADAEFIAAARTDVPALCDLVARLRKRLAWWEDAAVHTSESLSAARATIARVEALADNPMIIWSEVDGDPSVVMVDDLRTALADPDEGSDR